jgi:hypothetical protein
MIDWLIDWLVSDMKSHIKISCSDQILAKYAQFDNDDELREHLGIDKSTESSRERSFNFDSSLDLSFRGKRDRSMSTFSGES